VIREGTLEENDTASLRENPHAINNHLASRRVSKLAQPDA